MPDAPLDLDGYFRPMIGARFDNTQLNSLDVHAHRQAQLVYSSGNVVTVRTDDAIWVTPPWRAVWVPGGVQHAVNIRGEGDVLSVFVEPDFAPDMPTSCSVLMISSLCRELIIAICGPEPMRDAAEPRWLRLAAVLMDELIASTSDTTMIRLPSERRARRLAELILADPAGRQSLEDYGRAIGASPRTLTRQFVKETGLTASGWRQQLHLLLAIQKLGGGAPVQQVSADLGYDMPSAFIAMFRRAMGCTPKTYIQRAAGSLRKTK